MTNQTSNRSLQSVEIAGHGTLDDARRNIGRQPPAARVRAALARAGVLAVRIIGPPGSGKTELIEATLKRFPGPRRVAVIAVDPASVREADRRQDRCGYVAHLDRVVPDPAAIWRIVSLLRLQDFDFILIEGCGGMAPMQDIGQDATAAVVAVSGGDDKALEYRAMLHGASVILLTKSDVRPMVKFSDRVFRSNAQAIAPKAEIIELSAVSGSGMYRWFAWLNSARAAKRWRQAPSELQPSSGNACFR